MPAVNGDSGTTSGPDCPCAGSAALAGEDRVARRTAQPADATAKHMPTRLAACRVDIKWLPCCQRVAVRLLTQSLPTFRRSAQGKTPGDTKKTSSCQRGDSYCSLRNYLSCRGPKSVLP